MHFCLSYCGNIIEKGPIILTGLSTGLLQGKKNQLLARYCQKLSALHCQINEHLNVLFTFQEWPLFITKLFNSKGNVTSLTQHIFYTQKYIHTYKQKVFFCFFVFVFLPKCKLDEDPCDESDGGGVSECPGVWLGRGMPIGLGEEENPRLL